MNRCREEELEKMLNNKDFRVRIIVARKGYGLDRLINDENEFVRREVAKQGMDWID